MWHPGGLPTDGSWHRDGPLLPLEFARESSKGRITLVISKVEKLVPSLWTLMPIGVLDEAKSALANREGIQPGSSSRSIGYWNRLSGEEHGKYSTEIATWAKAKGFSAAVWTNLKCGFRETRGQMPAYDEIATYIRNLTSEGKGLAEEYVRRAPLQIRTEYRAKLEDEFGWTRTEN